MRSLRKLLPIALVILFGLPLISPLFALSGGGETNLPACCRRNGKHHCMMSVQQRGQLADEAPAFRSVSEKCPYSPASLTIAYQPHFGIAPSDIIFVGLISHPAVHAQTESKRRISLGRSRQKRGPPSLLLY